MDKPNSHALHYFRNIDPYRCIHPQTSAGASVCTNCSAGTYMNSTGSWSSPSFWRAFSLWQICFFVHSALDCFIYVIFLKILCKQRSLEDANFLVRRSTINFQSILQEMVFATILKAILLYYLKFVRLKWHGIFSNDVRPSMKLETNFGSWCN